ncbi:type II toxin-antitoxin system Phd/YefM family antitoxin [Nitrococcus mobilis]|uniref:Prevent-host-death protein n=1 Tax=Nitrococcus mobilis Nb-231 TaxID=314278 RepID=A4BME4_9GAMM|nr:type II toxin-antitoxin system Phd/YefM family antitoxin [Nitrococcus mobilis]EAR23482.1 Prevent-host-death protein [Nitrococcus mobilis Nb-231]
MDNVISAQELKRRGIGAIDAALRDGPVHVIRRNRPCYVILSEEDYQRLVDRRRASERLWERLLTPASTDGRSAREINAELEAERGAWDDPHADGF